MALAAWPSFACSSAGNLSSVDSERPVICLGAVSRARAIDLASYCWRRKYMKLDAEINQESVRTASAVAGVYRPLIIDGADKYRGASDGTFFSA